MMISGDFINIFQINWIIKKSPNVLNYPMNYQKRISEGVPEIIKLHLKKYPINVKVNTKKYKLKGTD